MSKPDFSAKIGYQVNFTAGEYKYVPQTGTAGNIFFMIIKNGAEFGFAFEENSAKQICLALSLADEYVKGNGSVTGKILATLQGLRQ